MGTIRLEPTWILSRNKYRRVTAATNLAVAIHLCFVLVVYHILKKEQTPQSLNVLSAVDASWQHFINTLGLSSRVTISDRGIAISNGFSMRNPINQEQKLFRFFIHDYLSFHKQNRYNNSRVVIFRPDETGIGDRANVLFSIYWMAVLAKRVLLIDWQRPFPLQDFLHNANSGNNFFFDPKQDKNMGCSSQNSTLCQNRIALDSEQLDLFWESLVSPTKTVILHTNKIPYTLPTDFLSSAALNGLDIQSVQRFLGNANFYRAFFHHVLRLSPKARKEQEILNRMLNIGEVREDGLIPSRCIVSACTRQPYIGVHARIGKGVGEYQPRFAEITKNMDIAASCLASRAVRLSIMYGTSPLPVYLATDTVEFKEKFRNAVRIMSHGRVEVVHGDWTVFHSVQLGKNNSRPQRSSLNREKETSAIWGTYRDLVMLGHAAHIIALYSSFPRFAQAIGTAEALVELRNDICLKLEKWR